MTQDATDAALERLERAVARLERAGAPPAATRIAEAYALLDERHGLLRARVQDTIARLDALIAGAPPAGGGEAG